MQWVSSPLPKTLRWILCEGPVHPGGVQQEGDVLQTGLLSGEVEDLPHIQMIVEGGLVRCRLLSGCCGNLSRRRGHIVKKDLVVLGHEDYRIVVILNDGLRAVLRCLHGSVETFGVDVEFLGRIGQGYLDPALGGIGLGLLHIGGSQVLEHLQTVVRVAALHGQGHGDVEPHHAGAGDADAHGVLEDVGAHLHADLRRTQGSVQRTCLGYGQCYRDGFGAAQGGLHLAVQKLEYVRISSGIHRSLCVIICFQLNISRRPWRRGNPRQPH